MASLEQTEYRAAYVVLQAMIPRLEEHWQRFPNPHGQQDWPGLRNLHPSIAIRFARWLDDGAMTAAMGRMKVS